MIISTRTEGNTANSMKAKWTSLKMDVSQVKRWSKVLACLCLVSLLPAHAVNAATYLFHNDHLGTPQALTDGNQQVVWQSEQEPFGKISEVVNSVEQDLRFSGQYFDEEAGLHYNLFRDYDSSIGRYITSDPIGLAGGLNSYGYVGANPLMYTDPYGLFSVTDLPTVPQWFVDGAAGFGDTLSFGLTDKVRNFTGSNAVVDQCSASYNNGELAGLGVSLTFGGAHLGRNALYQTGRTGGLGKGARRLFSDSRAWGTVRDMWSKAAGNGGRALAARGQSLHHWLIPQRSGAVNAGWNYLPLSASFNSYMNNSTLARKAVEWGFRGTILGIYGAPIMALGSDDCGC